MAAVCLWFVSCSSAPSTASELAGIMCKAWVEPDGELWVKYMHTPKPPSSDAEREKWVREYHEMLEENPLSAYEIQGEKLSDDGKKATVTVKVSYKDGDEKVKKIPFVKTDSGWKMDGIFW
jgi:hypothetical protein